MNQVVNKFSKSSVLGMKAKLVALGLATGLALSLTACGGGASKTGSVVSYDISKLKADPEIAALVPAENQESLKVAMDIPYSPAEFFDENNQAVGYEVDALKALAKIMGVKNIVIADEDFDALIPMVNEGDYDMIVASMTLTKERMKSINLVAYVQAGYIYATQAGNPKNFDYADPCGFKVGTQADTSQAEMLQATNDACAAEGKQPLTIVADPDQDKLVAQVVDGSLDAVIGESPMMKFAEVNNEQFETVGEVLGVAPQGMATAKGNEALAKAVQAGLQKMMDDGTLKEVFKPWGQDSIVLNFATLNPPIM
ncbi:MAG: transporter substrate-binding domain-containing protein [Mobiluncus porci]|uniref:transporter substrate-binding domain-containing protein n=1 Tax=Mobiluncus porci TaxID=2652278 RepID=UPI0023F22DB1|nr:transporter substrate-binding domain-containing protein [Mobiluncus porci]MDD7540810.1 transporter substrate-binding domain-containing protein [Mobiluncus porci]MDY5749174.1 transporter substrate-binding domain-containing protein [Mobiluncus porci]